MKKRQGPEVLVVLVRTRAKTLKPGELTKYQEPIIDSYRTVRNIREQMAGSYGEALVENKAPFQLKANFFSTLHITDSRVKKILNDWFKDQLTETIQGRGLQQEHKHSGILTVRIERVRDPKALLWVRNDVQGSWRKKPLMQTGRISNNRNPRWGFEDSKTIFTGSFEASIVGAGLGASDIKVAEEADKDGKAGGGKDSDDFNVLDLLPGSDDDEDEEDDDDCQRHLQEQEGYEVYDIFERGRERVPTQDKEDWLATSDASKSIDPSANQESDASGGGPSDKDGEAKAAQDVAESDHWVLLSVLGARKCHQ
ncbi:hypothetical protein AK812_SmicGene12407 [Symbiodinium microadriaticum]|uniref:Uncharacterized protein n=1 Tax=Symbiodinium microadriaticum TaxID=2951 RepID=A0A1Q9EAQ0_SYMMI|nr:hypothetical protein AK812_SmicGene12407 [Symbiodinium microadriaticum]